MTDPTSPAPQASAEAPQSAEEHDNHPTHGFWHDLKHHLVVASAVASLVGVLHHTGQLAWLDSWMLQLTGSAHAQKIARPSANDIQPQVLLIDRPMYETTFRQRSPLDRQSLTLLFDTLRTLPEGPPDTLVVDLDLSDNADDAHQAGLDLSMQALVQQGTHLVLPLPNPATTPSLVSTKLAWMRQACAWKPARPEQAAGEAKARAADHDRTDPVGASGSLIRFASPELRVSGGQVLQFSEHELTLGMAALSPPHAEDVCQWPDERLRALLQTQSAGSLRRLSSGAEHAPEASPFNAHFFGGLDDRVHVLSRLDVPPQGANGSEVALSKAFVYLGGSYDARDRFGTPLDPEGLPVEGVVLHAAVQYSAQHPVRVEQGIWALLIDVVLGVMMGFVFTKLWHWEAAGRRRGGWAGYVQSRGLWVVTLGVAAVTALLTIWAAARYAYPSNLWISPGPILIGVLAKLMLSGGEHGKPNRHHSKWVDRTVLGALVLGNLLLMFNH